MRPILMFAVACLALWPALASARAWAKRGAACGDTTTSFTRMSRFTGTYRPRCSAMSGIRNPRRSILGMLAVLAALHAAIPASAGSYFTQAPSQNSINGSRKPAGATPMIPFNRAHDAGSIDRADCTAGVNNKYDPWLPHSQIDQLAQQGVRMSSRRSVRNRAMNGHMSLDGLYDGMGADKIEFRYPGHEVADILVGRIQHDFFRCADLHNPTVLHDRDSVADPDRFVEVVGDEHGGLLDTRREFHELVLKLPSDQRVQR